MRVSLYNQMFAMKGNSVLSNLTAHWAIHFQKNINQIRKRENVHETTKTIKKANSDIIGITEVVEGQEKQFEKLLNNLGYKHVFFGKGHKTKHTNIFIKVVIASKIKCKKIKDNKFPVIHDVGGGGGFLHCKFSDFDVICTHFAAAFRKELYLQEKIFLQKYVKKIKNKVIIMGDFNAGYPRIKDFFPDYELASGRIKTCSTTPLFSLFFSKDLDHIFVKGMSSKNKGSIMGKSDHKMIFVDL